MALLWEGSSLGFQPPRGHGWLWLKSVCLSCITRAWPPSPGRFQEEINLKDKWGLEQSTQQCFQTKSKQLFIKGQIAGR